MPRRARLIFADDFSGTRLDPRRWITCYPWASPSGCTNPSNHELEWYNPAGVRISGGALHLTASPTKPNDAGPGDERQRFPYTSGMLATAGRFQFSYGYVEVRARMPAGQGLWPALWLLPADQSWPPEIDLVEVLGQHPTTATLTYHSVAAGTPQAHVVTRDLSVGWHVFALDWEPGSLSWFIDGVRRFHVTNNVPAKPMYLLANLAVGGTEPGPPDATTPFPASLDISYVRVWQADP